MEYIVTIGLEVHAQIATQSKMFDACSADYAGGEPNTRVSVVSLGLPGALPVLNQRAVELAALTGLAINATVNRQSVFARKSYIYPDLTKGYQISQYDQPLCSDGYLDVEDEQGGTKRIGIERLHIEEDTGRLVHMPDGSSLIDYNRSGVPLMEIVSRPDITSPEEAKRYFQKLRQILIWLGVNSGNMEEGALRCDANVSVRPVGQADYNPKVEIKNVNSFRALELSLHYEIRRQIEIIEHGRGELVQETRGWNEASEVTVAQRRKEFADDYRYFPDPDIPPLVLSTEWIGTRYAELPELPDQRRGRFEYDYGLSRQDAGMLTIDRQIADYYESAVHLALQYGIGAKDVANWIVGELFRLLKDENVPVTAAADRMPPVNIANLLDLLQRGSITRTVAKEVFAESFITGKEPARIVAEKGLIQIHDSDALLTVAREVVSNNPKAVADYRSGKTTASAFLVGQLMKATKGQANPQTARQVIEQALDEN